MTILTNRESSVFKIIEKAKTDREFTGTKILTNRKISGFGLK
jgi:hypothetical protein